MKNFEVKLNKVRFEYKFIRTIDVGIVLKGNEVKGVKSKEFSFVDAYCFFKGGELFVKNFIINNSEDPNREKKLLLQKEELRKLERDLVKGLTVVPYKVFSNQKGMIKCTIVLSRRNKMYDKKQNLKEKDLKKENKFGNE
jgi:SsrA-binding protein